MIDLNRMKTLCDNILSGLAKIKEYEYQIVVLLKGKDHL